MPTLGPTSGCSISIPGDVVLMCSDGLTKHVDDEALRTVLSQDISAESMARELLQAALDDGGTDNITVVVGRMGIG